MPPLISLVVPMYRVERWLPDFFTALETQTDDLADIELLFIDDGSPDESAALAEAWLATHGVVGRVVSKPNGGLSDARNRGLDEASGSWVNFPDPDDAFSANYVATVREFLTSPAADGVHLVSTNLMMLDDETGEITDTHPLRAKFARGRRVVDLDESPTDIHLQAASAFYRRDRIENEGLRFDERVRPNFEDGHFTARYLDSTGRPRVALLPEAEYHYRRRADGSSLIQGSWGKPEKYRDLLEHGYLSVLQTLAQRHGAVPRWAQTLIVYDLFFFFRHDERQDSATAGISAQSSASFWRLLRQILAFVDTEVIEQYDIVPVSDEARATMIMVGKGEHERPATVQVDIRDTGRHLVRAWYWYVGDPPVERWTRDGHDVTPVYAKHRAVRYLGSAVMTQRIAWLPDDGMLAVDLDGASVPLLLGGLRGTRADRASAADLARRVKTVPNPPLLKIEPPTRDPFWVEGDPTRVQMRRLVERIGPFVTERRARTEAATLTKLAATDRVRAKYADAWLLLDRDDQAQDNAERLYEYLRDHQPQVNAWFVLDRHSHDWDRLRRKGFRLLAFRSREHTLALLNAAHLISSQIDYYVITPLLPRHYRPHWRFTFLQHGVTKDDLSVWINLKPIERMITATPDEHASIVDDDTPYRYTEHEVALTGFPRHDRLLQLAEAKAPDERRTVLVAPTWRRELLAGRIGEGNTRRLRDDFWHSEYARQWQAFLEHELLHEAAQEHGWQVVFLPHPNMADYLDESPLGAHVHVRRYRDVDVQDVLAGAGVLVTDYSSMAFEVGYLHQPVVYFQFDSDTFFSGTHAYRRGDWSYERSGFGPVTTSVDDAVRATTSAMADGAVDPYLSRMVATFPLRDGQCARRTYESIRALDGPTQ